MSARAPLVWIGVATMASMLFVLSPIAGAIAELTIAGLLAIAWTRTRTRYQLDAEQLTIHHWTGRQSQLPWGEVTTLDLALSRLALPDLRVARLRGHRRRVRLDSWMPNFMPAVRLLHREATERRLDR